MLASGQPGLTTNFILREGGEETEGLVKYTTSDYDLRRFDGYISGKVDEDFYYMIGGYISSSPGVRNSDFNFDEGRQITINLTKNFENSSINFFHRDTDDHGTWYLPVALNVPGVDNEYNQIGTLNRQRRILFANDNGDPNFQNPGAKTLDLGEGRGWDGSMTGGSFKADFADGWQLVERFSFTDGDADTTGLVPDGGAVQIGALRADPTIDALAVINGPITGSVSGRAIGDDEFIQRFGAWEVLKKIEAFTNDISITKTWDTGTVTVGIYSANASTDEVWSLGNHKYEVVGKDGEVVTGIACNDPAIDSCNWNFDIDATGNVTTNALYVAGNMDVTDRLTLDAGIRLENHEIQYSVDVGLDGGVDFAVPDFDETETSWTIAANYNFTDTMGGFVRFNTGSKMPSFDDFRDNQGAFAGGNLLIQDVDQFELGFKWVTDNLSVYATAFYTEVDPSIFVALAGAAPGVISKTEATGLEVDAVWATDNGFSLNLNGTVQKSEFEGGPNDGNRSHRQPDWQMRLSPSYSFDYNNISATLYGTFTAVDDRWSDPGNTVELDGYEKVDLGVIVRINDQLSLQVTAENITDDDGLTEGDPRNPAAPNGRFILP